MTVEEAFRYLIAPIKDCNRLMLRAKVIQLKQSDGEGQAVGEMLERACTFLDATRGEYPNGGE